MKKQSQNAPVELAPVSDEEDAAIAAAVASDPDTVELTAEWFEGARLWRDDHPEAAHGVKPKFAQEVIERLKKTEPETAERLAAHNRNVEDAELKYQAVLEAEAAGAPKAKTA